ncbi:MAG: hypothetical protein IT340_01495 [Chloroflexi bacterium]|nr:hypothetical protein [Chloroflexota bacterium]
MGDSITEAVTQIAAALRTGSFGSEDAIKQGIILRLLVELGWPIFDPAVVYPEYPIVGQRVDYALFNAVGQPVVLIEAKALGQIATGQEQLQGYAFARGVDLAVLTDGARWEIYLPGARGEFAERLVYTLDLQKRAPQEVVERLKRYLSRDAVNTGTAARSAREDHESETQRRVARGSLPTAWRRLVDEHDDLLLDLLADKTAEVCGFRPDVIDIGEFLSANLVLTQAGSTSILSARQTAVTAAGLPSPVKQVPLAPTEPRDGRYWFDLDDTRHRARTGVDLLVKVFQALADRDPTFLERFADQPKHGRTRRFLARRPEELFPDRPDLVSSSVRQIKPGWYIGLNVSHDEIKRRIERARDFASRGHGLSFEFHLG